MKKKLTLALLALTTATVHAQHDAKTFVGQSKMTVLTSTTENKHDTITFVMKGITAADITLPEMKGMNTIPAITISNVTFTMGDNHEVNFPQQTFTTTVNADGEEKEVVGSKLTGTYNMADNALTLEVEFKYGSMPFAMTYQVEGYYVKAVTAPITVVVGGAYTYENPSVTYNVRKYKEGDEQLVDVAIPAFSLDNTLIGNLTLGAYTVCGLKYDDTLGAYYRDYRNDNLSFSFKAENNGATLMDDIYPFNPDKDNNIMVRYNGNKVEQIVNAFQMGAMPFPIVSTFNADATAINKIKTNNISTAQAYNLQGQPVDDNYKGIVIINGKKILRK